MSPRSTPPHPFSRACITLALAALLAVGLTACGEQAPKKKPAEKSSTGTSETPAPAPATGAASGSPGAASGAESGDPGGGSLFHVGRIVAFELEVGKGEPLEEGYDYLLEYEMTLTTGKVIEKSEPGKFKRFEYQGGQILPGWEKGMGVVKDDKRQKLKPMRVGGKRKLIIPGEWAFAHRDWGRPIPAGVKPKDTIIVVFTVHPEENVKLIGDD